MKPRFLELPADERRRYIEQAATRRNFPVEGVRRH